MLSTALQSHLQRDVCAQGLLKQSAVGQRVRIRLRSQTLLRLIPSARSDHLVFARPHLSLAARSQHLLTPAFAMPELRRTRYRASALPRSLRARTGTACRREERDKE